MVATKRRFNPNLQRVRIFARRAAHAGVRLHPVPQSRQGPKGRLSRAAAELVARDVRGRSAVIERTGSAAGQRVARHGRLAARRHSEPRGRRRRIDDLNVYPVPDGDTGTNLTLTVRAVMEALDKLEESDRERLAQQIARAALMGARGNSGVILSQIVRGFADVLGDAQTIDSRDARARVPLRERRRVPRGARAAGGDDATVIRELAEEAERRWTRSRISRSPTCCGRSCAGARMRSRARRSTSRSCARRVSSTPEARACSSLSAV